MTDEQMHADKGEDWKQAHAMIAFFDAPDNIGGIALEAMHDRDRFQRDRDYWREECIDLAFYALS